MGNGQFFTMSNFWGNFVCMKGRVYMLLGMWGEEGVGKCTISKGGGAVAIRGSMRERGGKLFNLILR